MVGRRRTSALLARGKETSALVGALDAAEQGFGRLVLVGGESGAGKTRLIEEFARNCDARCVWGHCVDGGSETLPYGSWIELLSSLVRELGDAVVGDARGELRRLLSELGGEAEEVPGDGRALLFEAVVDVLGRAARAGQLVCVLEDIHWIDPAGRELLRAVSKRLRTLPIVLIATYRNEQQTPELRNLLSELLRAEGPRIELALLSDEDALSMVEALAGDGLDPETQARIVARGEGNPLFIEELVDASGIALPSSLRDLLLARCNGLAADARHLVQTAAVIGPHAPRAWLVAASGLTDRAAQAAARGAVDAGVLLADGDGRGYTFRHALLREATLDDLVPDERVAMHRAVARSLEEHTEIRGDVDRTSELARHWDAAEDAAEALRWSIPAARQARDRYAFDAARVLYERALFWWDATTDAATVAGMDHTTLLFTAADAAHDAAHLAAAGDLARAALDEALQLGPEACVDAFARARRNMWGAQRSDELLEFAAIAMPQIDHVDVGARARFLSHYLGYVLFDSRPDIALDLAEPTLDAVAEYGDPDIASELHQTLGMCYEIVGDFERADAELEIAAEIARKNELWARLTVVVYNRASILSSYPDHDGCQHYLDEVEELVKEHGAVRMIVAARTMRAIDCCALGDLDRARAALESLDADAIDGIGKGVFEAASALIALYSGDYEAALVDLAEAPGEGGIDAARFTERAMLRASALAWQGDIAAARVVVDDALALLKGRTEVYWHGWLTLVGTRVEAEFATRHDGTNVDVDLARAEALERAQVIVETWEAVRAGRDPWFPLADAVTAGVACELARLTGDDVPARAQDAARAFAAIRWPYYELYFRWREGEAVVALDDRAAARKVLADARRRATDLGFHGLVDEIERTARMAQLRMGPGKSTVDGDLALSARELEVLRLLAAGQSNPEIGAALCVSRRTARAHVSHILEKLQVSSRTEAVSTAYRRGIL